MHVQFIEAEEQAVMSQLDAGENTRCAHLELLGEAFDVEFQVIVGKRMLCTAMVFGVFTPLLFIMLPAAVYAKMLGARSLPHCRTVSPPHCFTVALRHLPTISLPHCLIASLPHSHCVTESLLHCLTVSLLRQVGTVERTV